MLKFFEEPVIEKIADNVVTDQGLHLYIKREDKLHPLVSGNKWRKLHYNLMQAKASGFETLLTFGGAYSNHIYATAAAAREMGFQSIGVIRGEEHLPLNPTLKFAAGQGMQIVYMDRTTYRRKMEEEVVNDLMTQYGPFYLIPEGGTNNLAIKGIAELVSDDVRKFDYVCLPVGTGGTIAGVVSGMQGLGKIIGFSALKGDFLQKEVHKLLHNYQDNPPQNWHICSDYHFGGYAKVNQALFQFINAFEKKTGIPLEPIYTGKMMYGIYDLIHKNKFPAGSKILAIHTGGLQGIGGMVERGILATGY